MSITAKWTLGNVILNNAQINQISRYDVNTAFDLFTNFGSGEVDPTFRAINTQRPELSATTVALKALLSAVSLNGLAISSTAVMHFRQKAQGGTLQTGGTGMNIAAAAGMIVVDRIVAEQRQEASADFRIIARSSDGTTAPLAVTTGATMTSLAASDQKFTVGPCYFGEDLLGSIKSFEYVTGIELDVDDSDGEVYPTWASIQRRDPSIKLTILNINQIASANLGQHGTLDSLPIAAFLKRIAKGGTRDADNASTHIGFTMQDGLYKVNRISGEDGREQMLEIEIHPSTPAAAAAVVVSIDADIEDPVA